MVIHHRLLNGVAILATNSKTPREMICKVFVFLNKILTFVVPFGGGKNLKRVDLLRVKHAIFIL